MLERAHDRLAGALYRPRVAKGEWRGGDPPCDDDDHRRDEERQPDQTVVGSPGVDVVQVDHQTGGEHQRHVDDDEEEEPDEHEEVQRARRLDAEDRADALEARGKRRRHAKSGDEGERRGDKDGDEIGDQLEAVVRRPAVIGRPVQREVLDQHGQGVRKHVPGRRDEPLPAAGREQQDVEHHAVEEPDSVDAQMPPACESDRVAKPRKTDVAREADRILLGRPERVGRHRLLDSEPVPPGRRVPRPVQARMIRQDLDA